MPYTLSFNLNAGTGNTNPALCSAVLQPHGTLGTAVLPSSTTVVNTGSLFYFKSRGGGLFSFVYDAMPDDFSGNVDFSYNSIIVASANINPQETEYSNVKTSLVAASVWSSTTRTLTAAFLSASDIADVVWSRTVRALTDKSGFALTTAPPTAAQIRSEIDSNSTKLDINVGSRGTFNGGAVASVTSAVTVGTNNDKTGYALTATERSAISAVVEASLLNEGDGQMLINAMVSAIGNTNIDQLVLVAALREDLERTGGNLATLLSRVTAAVATSTQLTNARDVITLALGTPQQSGVAVTLPPAPSGYGGGSGSGGTGLTEELENAIIESAQNILSVRNRLAEQVPGETRVVVIDAPIDPTNRVVRVDLTRWATGSANVAGVEIGVALVLNNGDSATKIGTQYVLPGGRVTLLSDANGIADFELVPTGLMSPTGAQYRFKAGNIVLKTAALPIGTTGINLTEL